MNAAAALPADREAVTRRDTGRGFVIELHDPQVASMQAQLQAGARQADAFLRVLVASASVLGSICLISQAARWCAL